MSEDMRDLLDKLGDIAEPIGEASISTLDKVVQLSLIVEAITFEKAILSDQLNNMTNKYNYLVDLVDENGSGSAEMLQKYKSLDYQNEYHKNEMAKLQTKIEETEPIVREWKTIKKALEDSPMLQEEWVNFCALLKLSMD
jgi:hypothetical protein